MQPVAGSYSPGTPIPMLATGPQSAMTVAATSASWAVTEAGTASGSETSRVGTRPLAMVLHAPAACSTTAHLRFVAPRSRPRWRVAGPAVIGVVSPDPIVRTPP